MVPILLGEWIDPAVFHARATVAQCKGSSVAAKKYRPSSVAKRHGEAMFSRMTVVAGVVTDCVSSQQGQIALRLIGV